MTNDDRKRRRGAYDPACLELAEHFLQDEPRLSAHELAQAIQQAVEDWIESERRAAHAGDPER